MARRIGRRDAGRRGSSTGETLVEVADATLDDAVAALDAAVAVQDEWARHLPRERGEILRRVFEAMNERADDLALLMTLEMGKPHAESQAEIAYAAEFLRWFSEEAVRIEGRYATAPNGAGRLITNEAAGGAVLRDHAVELPGRHGHAQIGLAVAAGCTMVIKPAQQTPLSMLALARLFEEAGLPAGVLNVITLSSSPRSRSRSSRTRGCASSPSRARPRSAASSSSSRRRGCCARRWSWAATRRSSSSRTPTWTPPSRAP